MCYYFGSGRLTVLERWLPSAVTILDRFHCTYCVLELVYMNVSMYICTHVLMSSDEDTTCGNSKKNCCS